MQNTDVKIHKEIFARTGEGITLSNKEGTISFADPPRAEAIFKLAQENLLLRRVKPIS